jgi:predicted Rdx family selenoprotein
MKRDGGFPQPVDIKAAVRARLLRTEQV